MSQIATTTTPHRRRTRILATLGPATDPPGVLDALLQAGVDVVRLNFSHGDPAAQVARATALREAARRCGVEVGILGTCRARSCASSALPRAACSSRPANRST